MKNKIVAIAMIAFISFSSALGGLSSRFSRVTVGTALCTYGVYALIQAKNNYDETKGASGLAHKAKSKANNFLDKIVGEKPDPVDSFFERNQHTIFATLWGGSGLGSIGLGLKLIFS